MEINKIKHFYILPKRNPKVNKIINRRLRFEYRGGGGGIDTIVQYSKIKN